MKNRHPRHSSQGFTLTELLVVIAIIAVLAALSMMITTRVRAMADKISATRSLSALQLANTMYSTEHNGNYIACETNDESGSRASIPWWFQNTEFLTYFRGEVDATTGNKSREIPTDKLDPIVVRTKANRWDRIYTSFGINVNGLPAIGGGNVKNGGVNFTTTTVSRPAESMAFASSCDLSVRYNSRFKWDGVEGQKSDSRMAYRHNGKALIVYFDGHVGEISMGEMRDIDRKGGSKSAFWKPNQE